jgi:hypothetical protein
MRHRRPFLLENNMSEIKTVSIRQVQAISRSAEALGVNLGVAWVNPVVTDDDRMDAQIECEGWESPKMIKLRNNEPEKWASVVAKTAANMARRRLISAERASLVLDYASRVRNRADIAQHKKAAALIERLAFGTVTETPKVPALQLPTGVVAMPEPGRPVTQTVNKGLADKALQLAAAGFNAAQIKELLGLTA